MDEVQTSKTKAVIELPEGVSPQDLFGSGDRHLRRLREAFEVTLVARERFVQVGNAAGSGAKLALVSRRCRGVAEEIARGVEYVELTTHPHFVEAYTAALMLP